MKGTSCTLMMQHTHIDVHTHLWVMQWGWQGQCPDDPLIPSGKLLSERQWESEVGGGGGTERKGEKCALILYKPNYKVISVLSHSFIVCLNVSRLKNKSDILSQYVLIWWIKLKKKKKAIAREVLREGRGEETYDCDIMYSFLQTHLFSLLSSPAANSTKLSHTAYPLQRGNEGIHWDGNSGEWKKLNDNEYALLFQISACSLTWTLSALAFTVRPVQSDMSFSSIFYVHWDELMVQWMKARDHCGRNQRNGAAFQDFFFSWRIYRAHTLVITCVGTHARVKGTLWEPCTGECVFWMPDKLFL